MGSWVSPFSPRSTADEVLAGIDLSGKVALVTGANTGIGYETARALAAAGARTIFACRDHARGQEAIARCEASHPRAEAELARLDLDALSSVRQCVNGLGLERLDMLICNAGIFPGPYRETRDGFERTVGVCHIGHFLLFTLLLPALEQSADARVVMVSSESHRTPARLRFDRLPLPREHYRPMVAYGQAKLCNVLMANEVERRYGTRGIHGYALHPGTLVTTEIGRNSALARFAVALARPFAKSPAQGAATSVLCAAHPDVRQLGGRYFRDVRLARSSREANDVEVAARLWQLSERWVGSA